MSAGERGENERALQLIQQAIDQDPEAARAYYVRGRERFRAFRISESLADFDRYAALRPDLAPRQWERGIACYYARRYDAGARQFESYQTYDRRDVENSVWRFLCLVPQVGLAEAQATMLPVEDDRRVPMMQILEMYRGELQPEEVLAATEAGEPVPEERAARRFYAHLYLGLWYDALGDAERARPYIELAADEKLKDNRGINRYMWDVARVHRRRLQGSLQLENEARPQ